MHHAVHWADKYSGRNFCNIPHPFAPPGPSALGGITAFERYRALQNLANTHQNLVMVLRIPDTRSLADPQAYLDALLKETALSCKHLSNRPQLQQLHVDGNAALFSNNQLQQLFGILKQYLQPLENNFSWLSINIQPSCASWALLGMLRLAGFNRITLDGNESCFLATKSLYDAARALQYKTLTLALQTEPASPATTERLQAILELQPDRILLHGNDTPPTNQLAKLGAMIEQAGYARASDTCFILPDDDLIENTCDTTTLAGQPVLGLGAGACSQLSRLYYCNESNIQDYIQTLTNNQLPPAIGCRLPACTD